MLSVKGGSFVSDSKREKRGDLYPVRHLCSKVQCIVLAHTDSINTNRRCQCMTLFILLTRLLQHVTRRSNINITSTVLTEVLPVVCRWLLIVSPFCCFAIYITSICFHLEIRLFTTNLLPTIYHLINILRIVQQVRPFSLLLPLFPIILSESSSTLLILFTAGQSVCRLRKG